MFVVNCAWYIRAGWTIVKPFLSEKTCEKIKIYGEDYKSDLLNIVESENLPEFLGGSCRCQPNGCLYQPEGPWKEYFLNMPNDKDETNFKFPAPPTKWHE